MAEKFFEKNFLLLLLIATTTIVTLTTATTPRFPSSFRSSSSSSSLIRKQSPGVYANEISGGRIYEAVGALTFEFQLPAITTTTTHNPGNNQNHTTNNNSSNQSTNNNDSSMVFDYDCTDGNFSAENYSCPVFYHLHKFRDDLLASIEMRQGRLHPESSTDSSFHIPSCDEIARHFTTTTISPAKLRRYQSLLRSCLDGLLVKAPLSLLLSQGPSSRPYFTGMVEGFVENYYKLLPSTGRMDKAILLNAITINNALGLTKLIMDSQSIVDGWSTCIMGSMIPSNLVPPETLRHSLDSLERLLQEKGMKLVIPNSDSDGSISEYYRTPGLADCVRTKRSLLVRILVPIQREEAEFKIFSLQSVPFIYNDGEDRTQLVCTVKDFDGQLYSYEVRSKRSFRLGRECDLKKSSLCHTGENPSAFMQNSRRTCASEILAATMMMASGRSNFERKKSNPNPEQQEGSSSLSRFCDLTCEPSHLFQTPIILRVASNKFYVAGQVNESITLSFNPDNNQRGKRQIFYPPEEGVWEMTLPCGAKIFHKQKGFVALEPCGPNLEVAVVRPIHLAPKIVVEVDNFEEEEVENVDEVVTTTTPVSFVGREPIRAGTGGGGGGRDHWEPEWRKRKPKARGESSESDED